MAINVAVRISVFTFVCCLIYWGFGYNFVRGFEMGMLLIICFLPVLVMLAPQKDEVEENKMSNKHFKLNLDRFGGGLNEKD